MATVVHTGKQKLAIASVAFGNKLGKSKSDPELFAYLSKLKKKAESESRNGRQSRSDSNGLDVYLNNYAVAKSSGLWLFFRPDEKIVTNVEKNEIYPPIKYIIADVPEGMAEFGSGRMMLALAHNRRTHPQILEIMRNAVALDNGVLRSEVENLGLLPPNAIKLLKSGATANVLGGGALEYVYSMEKQAIELFIDQNIFSGKYGYPGPHAILDVMKRINGCEGVAISYGCHGTKKEEGRQLLAKLKAMAREQ